MPEARFNDASEISNVTPTESWPGVRACSACMDVAAGAHTDAKEAVRRKPLSLERPENRVADIGWDSGTFARPVSFRAELAAAIRSIVRRYPRYTLMMDCPGLSSNARRRR